MTHRKLFIIELFKVLKDKRYSLLKFIEEDIMKIKDYSDIDLLIADNDKNEIINFSRENHLVFKCKIYKSTFSDVIYLFFKDGTFLDLDLISKIVRRDILYIEKNEILQNSISKNGIMLPEDEYQFLYVFLFYLLDKVDMEEKYIKYFSSMSDIKKNTVTELIKIKFGIHVENINELFAYQKYFYEKVLFTLSGKKNKLNYIVNILKYKKRAKIITLSGVDGAGKSTIIDDLKYILTKKYRRKVVVIRHRPSVLPILSAVKYGKKRAEEKTMEVLPRSGKNISFLSSLARFSYYLIDYIFGQWIVYFKYTFKGDTIIYDRYYFDFINDARRTNIQLNEKFIKFFYRFVFKPDINIFLYASPEIILSRKQEMDEKSIIELTSKYKTLFESLSDKKREKYVCIENIDKEKTLQVIEKLYIEVV